MISAKATIRLEAEALHIGLLGPVIGKVHSQTSAAAYAWLPLVAMDRLAVVQSIPRLALRCRYISMRLSPDR